MSRDKSTAASPRPGYVNDYEESYADCHCDGNPAGGACSYPDCQLPPPTTEELLGESAVLGYCPHGVNLDRDFCPKGCRV